MPTKKKSTDGKSSRKSHSRKSAKKANIKKKTVARKKTVKKSASKKKTAAKKTMNKRSVRRVKTAAAPATTVTVEPGPPPRVIPPVEEPVRNEEAIGTITHYYSHLEVAVVQVNAGTLRTGDRIRIKGHTTDFIQLVESMEYEHRHIDEAAAGESVGIKVKDHARDHDIVFKVK